MGGELLVRVTAAAVGVAHTFGVVTQTELAAVVRLWEGCIGGICGLLHRLLQA